MMSEEKDKIYYIIGRIVEITQKMEENLEFVVKFCEVVKENELNPFKVPKDFKIAEESAEYLRAKMESMTLGQRIHIICEARCFSRVEADQLRKILEKRNYFVHEYFKATPFEDFSAQDYTEEIGALKAYFDEVLLLNKKILVFKKSYKESYEKLKAKLG